MNLLSSTSVFTFFTLISRVLGYIRDILIAIFLGASIYADAFFVAFRLPNTFRRLFAEGTFNAAFVPSYTSEYSSEVTSAKKFADEVFTFLLIILLVIVFLAEIFTPFLVYIIAPGFYADSTKFELATLYTRITFPFLLFVSLSSFISAILNSHNKFAAASAAPIILNLFLITSLGFSIFFEKEIAKSLCYAVSLSGVVQLIFLIFFAKKFYKPSFYFKKKVSEKVNFFLKKLLPSILSSGVTQINILIGTIIASFQSGAVSYLYYADRVYQINLAIAGIAVGTVSLPVLSKALKENRSDEVENIQLKSLELSLLLSLPAAIGLVISSNEVINSLFGYGSFQIADVNLTAKALMYFALGIPAFSLIKIFSNFFFARNNTKKPFYISIIVVFINLLISISLFKKIGFLIIPIATSLSTWIGVIIYVYVLKRDNYFKLHFKNFVNLSKMIFSTILMAIILNYTLSIFEYAFDYSNSFKFIYLLFIISIAALIYLISCYLLGILNLRDYKAK